MRCKIIAEIGVNHDGSLKKAKDLIVLAKEAGADAVKFQTYDTNALANKATPKVPYQKIAAPVDESHWQMLKKLELTKEQHQNLFDYCNRLNIEFISTPYDPKSAEFLYELGVKTIKIASADVVDHLLLKTVSKLPVDAIISLGMATFEEIDDALYYFRDHSPERVSLLHCVSNYPCSQDSLNLSVISNLQKRYPFSIGFSDHSIGTQAVIVARALGAQVIEKHFSNDKSANGPDHRASSTPDEFSDLICSVRMTEKILGSTEKRLLEEELEMHTFSRKSAVASKDLNAGHKIIYDDIKMMRPGGGISGKNVFDLVGKVLQHSIAKGQQYSNENLK